MLEGLTYGDSEPCCLGWFVLVVIFVQRSFLLKNLLSSGPAYTSRRGRVPGCGFLALVPQVRTGTRPQCSVVVGKDIQGTLSWLWPDIASAV